MGWSPPGLSLAKGRGLRALGVRKGRAGDADSGRRATQRRKDGGLGGGARARGGRGGAGRRGHSGGRVCRFTVAVSEGGRKGAVSRETGVRLGRRKEVAALEQMPEQRARGRFPPSAVPTLPSLRGPAPALGLGLMLHPIFCTWRSPRPLDSSLPTALPHPDPPPASTASCPSPHPPLQPSPASAAPSGSAASPTSGPSSALRPCVPSAGLVGSQGPGAQTGRRQPSLPWGQSSRDTACWSFLVGLLEHLCPAQERG